MTTIAWDGKTLAGDGRVSSNEMVLPERFQKVVRGKKGHLGAIAGVTNMQSETFLDWVRRGCEGNPISPKEDSVYILVTPRGIVQEFSKGENVMRLKHNGYYAWGSGRGYAVGALAHGASSREAVQIAMRFDPYTGGKITAFTLEKFQ